MEPSSDITIFSLNTKGFNELRQTYVNDISVFCDLLCIQEHWLLKQHLYKIENCLPNFKGHAVSGMSERSAIIEGRPYGGCAILWRDAINHNITKLPLSSDRACAVRVAMGDRNLILICIYMPTDTQTQVFNQSAIEMLLAEIRTLTLSHPYDDVVVAGDFNIDLSRDTPMVHFVNTDLLNMSLNSLWHYYDVDFTYQSMADNNVTSVLDHFYVTQPMVLSCVDAGVIHNVHNTSDHSVIFFKWKCNVNINRNTTNVNHKVRTAWHKATQYDIDNYHKDLENNLCKIEVPSNMLKC